MKRFWLSWYGGDVEFELDTPWWTSGWRCDDNAPTIVAAVIAPDAEAAKALVVAAHRAPVELEWRFCDEQPAGWHPFGNTRFPRLPWMRWPDSCGGPDDARREAGEVR